MKITQDIIINGAIRPISQMTINVIIGGNVSKRDIRNDFIMKLIGENNGLL